MAFLLIGLAAWWLVARWWHYSRQREIRHRVGDIFIFLDHYMKKPGDPLPDNVEEAIPEYYRWILNDPVTGKRIVYVGAGKKWFSSNVEVIAYSPVTIDEGRWVQYSDGHLAFVTGDKLAEILAREKR